MMQFCKNDKYWSAILCIYAILVKFCVKHFCVTNNDLKEKQRFQKEWKKSDQFPLNVDSCKAYLGYSYHTRIVDYDCKN